ncbi:M20 family metallopeptidase [Nonomuraea sp. LP-02]|uniref:M20 metallopeptidase family protein n=1 Tax=Nonomuraea sp. LP-02 TaxID=3097960 RepID=UPI002E3020D7|nr:M20 family metallopeptidase [Nonomuraea sp. LP-02]MED7928021.1 M20 family metallopeptidase [Nonomuraea sp. LP-02]
MSALTPESLRADAAALADDLVALRRRLHAEPEVGFDLPRTQAAIVEALKPLDLDIRLGERLSSVTAVLRGDRPGPSVLLRADMDALAIQEETGLAFASRNGAMHACGHDLHVAGLVGAARLLAARRSELRGSVVLMFQPGEEAGGGAPLMIEEGVLDAAGQRVEAAYGIHVFPGTPGTFSTRPAALMAGANVLRVRVTGRGGHGSRPHEAVDPVPVLAEIVLAFQTYVTRRVPVFDPIVISVAKLSAGDVLNVIPERAELAGTVRTLSKASAERLAVELPALASRIAEGHGCRAETEFEVVYPVTVNDAECAEGALSTLAATFGPERAQRLESPVMASEDFSFVLDEVPGAFVFVGATPAHIDPERAEMNHSPRAVFDDGVLADQAVALAALALRHVGG